MSSKSSVVVNESFVLGFDMELEEEVAMIPDPVPGRRSFGLVTSVAGFCSSVLSEVVVVGLGPVEGVVEDSSSEGEAPMRRGLNRRFARILYYVYFNGSEWECGDDNICGGEVVKLGWGDATEANKVLAL